MRSEAKQGKARQANKKTKEIDELAGQSSYTK